MLALGSGEALDIEEVGRGKFVEGCRIPFKVNRTGERGEAGIRAESLDDSLGDSIHE